MRSISHRSSKITVEIRTSYFQSLESPVAQPNLGAVGFCLFPKLKDHRGRHSVSWMV